MILHVSGDFPDVINAAKTPVIERLVGLVAGRFEQRVISLNRRSPGSRFVLDTALHGGKPTLTIERWHGKSVDSMIYHAPSRGLYHRMMLERLGDWIADAAATGPPPRLMVAYKLTIEGIAVAHAAWLLGIPYVVVIQGNTDVRILRARPDLRTVLSRVFHGAAFVFAFAPWALTDVERLLGKRQVATAVIPCPMAADMLLSPRAGDGTIVSAFHLRNWRGKNLVRLIAAGRQVPGMQLAIIGGGDVADEAAVTALVEAGDGVVHEGALDQAAMTVRMNAASGFALPSLAESFGLVFVESLFAGTPILYPRGTAIDGYFDGLPFAIPVAARNEDSIAEGLARLSRDERLLKSALSKWQSGPEPRRFFNRTIAMMFGEGLAQAMMSPAA